MGKVVFRDCACLQNKIFFFIAVESIPVMLDLDTGKSILLSIKNRNEFRNIPFDLITVMDNKIYALEMSGDYMCEYSLETQYVRYIKIDCANRVDGNFALLQREKERIYIFDRVYGVSIYDAQSDKIEKIPYPIRENEIITGCSFKDQYFLLPQNGNRVFVFDSLKKTWNTIHLPITLRQVVHVAADQEDIYILMKDGTIIEWDGKKSFEFIDVVQKKYNSENVTSRICITKNNLIVLPSLVEDILKIDRENRILETVNDYPEDFHYVNVGWTKYVGYCETEDNYIFACRASQYLLKISKMDEKISWIRSEVDSAELYQYEHNLGTIREREGYLSFFFKEIISR